MDMKKTIAALAAALTLTGCASGKKAASVDDDDNEVVVTVEASEASSESETEEITAAALPSEEETTSEDETLPEEETTEPATKTSAERSGFNALYDLELGMNKDEVFAILGGEPDRSEEAYVGGGAYYVFASEKDEVFGTGLPVDLEVAFNSEETLYRVSYTFGRTGDLETGTYPFSEEELAEAYSKILSAAEENYGPSTLVEDETLEYLREERNWETPSGVVWILYGVNLWREDAPEKYEDGINEVIIDKVDESIMFF